MSLKKLRIEKGLRQVDIAQFLGCTQVTYQRYESGDREPSIAQLKNLSAFFGVSIDRIVDNAPESFELSFYEAELVEASRKADERARKDALALLKFNCKYS